MTAEPRQDPEVVRRRGIGPFSLRQIVVVLAVVVAAALGLVLLTRPLGTTSTTTPRDPSATFYVIGGATEGLRVGDRAPDLGGGTTPLADLDGRPISLAALRGRPVWVTFWATWCPPCQAETPILRDTYDAHRADGLALVAVAVQETSPDDVRAYAQRYGLDYTIAFDGTGDAFRQWRINGLPTQFLIDADGVIRRVIQGPFASRGDADAALAAILPTSPGPSPSPAASPAVQSPGVQSPAASP